jgi:hypothetical protein
MRVEKSGAILFLLCLPTGYFLVAYLYLAWWHGKVWLFDTLVHENGRLTLLGSLFFFDHFLACLPMILLFALCVAGGFALGAQIRPSASTRSHANFIARNTLLPLPVFIVITFLASVRVAGWEQTRDYAFQYIERDGILSPGGNWNQLQISNIPIALGSIALAFACASSWTLHGRRASMPVFRRGLVILTAAVVFSVTLSVFWWPGCSAFLNPRWLAHSVREIATYPLTGIPIALASVAATHVYVTRTGRLSTPLRLTFPRFSVFLIALAILLLTGQLILLRDSNIHSLAQRPAFAPDGLSIPHLLAAHVFEHFLDFVIIGPLSAGIYALALVTASVAPNALSPSSGSLSS